MSAATAGLVPFWRLASHQRPRLTFQKVSPLYQRNLLGSQFVSEDPLQSVRGARELMSKPRPMAVNNLALLFPLRSVQFSLVQFQFSYCVLSSLFDHYIIVWRIYRLHAVQYIQSSVVFQVFLVWTSNDIIFFLRSLSSNFSCVLAGARV